MRALAITAATIAVAVGIWLVVVGLHKVDRTPEAKPTRTAPFGHELARFLGLADGGPLARHRWVFLGSIVVGIVAAITTGWYILILILPAAVVGLPSLVRKDSSSREAERLSDLEAWIRSLAGILVGGAAGLEQALRASLASAPRTVRPALSRLVARLDAQQPIKPALRLWADEMNDATADLIAAALILESDRREGAISRALEELADTVGQRASSMLEIESERESPRSNARWITLITLGFLGLMAFTNPVYMEAYEGPFGQLLALVFIAAYVGCLLWMRKIAMGRPQPRFLTATERS